MKKFLAIMLLLTLVFIGVACGDDSGQGGGGDVVKPTSVAITNAKAEYVIGEPVKLEASVEPSNATVKTIEWTSSNENVATIDANGNITFKDAGETVITATCKGDGSVKDSKTIKVSRPELSSIDIVLNNTVVEGFTTNASVTTTPKYADASVTWSSSDETIATVDEKGIVTAIKIGQVTITAVSKVKESVKASKQIEVVAKPEVSTPPTSITIEGPETATVGYTLAFKASVYPVNANQNVVWESLDPEILIIDENGLATPLAEGSTRVRCVSAVDAGIKSNMIKVTITEEVIHEPQDLKGYKIVIMNASSALIDFDPFLEGYVKPDKMYKQAAWQKVEKDFNCDIAVEPYPDTAPWGSARINYIIDNAANGTSTADICIVSNFWLHQFANSTTNAAADVTDLYNKYGNQQMTNAEKDAGTFQGKLYTASTGLSRTATYIDLGLFYNVAWVEKLGVEDPAQMFVDGKWNYTGFKEWCLSTQALLDSSQNQYVVGGHPFWWWLGMTSAAGIKVCDPTAMEVNIDSQRSKDASNIMYQITAGGGFDPAYTWAETDGGFIAGTTVMSTGALWFLNNSSRWSNNMFGEDTRYGYVPFPYPDDMAKEDTRVAVTEFSIQMYTAGRESAYPDGVTLDGVYQAVNTMYLDTVKNQENNPSYDPDTIIYNSLSSNIENDASIECVKWFTAGRVFYDPIYCGYPANSNTPLNTPAINTMIKGNDYQQEFDAVRDQFESNFKRIFSK